MPLAPDLPARPDPDTGWEIRRQHPTELPLVMALSDAAFGPRERIGALVEALQRDDCFADGSCVTGSFVAVADGRIVGHTMLTRSWVDAEERLLTIPVLSPLAVHPDSQGRGLGGALVAYAVGEAARAGAMGVILEGDPAYYGRLGFEPAEPWGLLRPSPHIPSWAFQWARLASHEPWMRGRVVYPDVFWRFDAVGLRGWRGAASSLEVTTVTLGARDVARLARFYAELLGRPVPDVPAGVDWVPVRDEDGGITLAIQLEPEQDRVTWPAAAGEQHMQVHVEIRADDLEAALAHAVSCGATPAQFQPQEDVRVCLDPEGHPFCLWVAAG